MRSNKSLITMAAAFAVAGMGWTTVAPAQDTAAERTENAAQRTGDAARDTAERTGAAAERAADKTGQTAEKAMKGQGIHGTAAAPDAEGIRDVLASTTEAAFTRGGFDDLVERFVDNDRNRIGNFAEQDHDDLNAKIDAFLTAWKDKYNQDFDIEKEELVYSEKVKIQQGEIGGAARLAGEKVDADVDTDTRKTPDGGTRTDVDVNVQNNTGVDRPDSKAADANRNDPGRNVASVTIPASHGLPETRVPLVHEFPDAWKIDLPDTVDGPKLKANLSQAIDKVMAQKGQWPADVNEAYLAVSHTVLNGLVGTPGGGAAAPGALPGRTTPPADAQSR
jgi:hypothetical protein